MDSYTSLTATGYIQWKRTQMPHHPPSRQSKNKFILIADSDRASQLAIEKVLLKAGIDTISTQTGKEALGLYEADPDRWSMILIDCEMPVMDGFSIACSIRQFERKNNLRAINIIGMSNCANCEFASKSLRGGMNGYLAKPLGKYQLLEMVSRDISLPREISSTD